MQIRLNGTAGPRIHLEHPICEARHGLVRRAVVAPRTHHHQVQDVAKRVDQAGIHLQHRVRDARHGLLVRRDVDVPGAVGVVAHGLPGAQTVTASGVPQVEPAIKTARRTAEVQ